MITMPYIIFTFKCGYKVRRPLGLRLRGLRHGARRPIKFEIYNPSDIVVSNRVRRWVIVDLLVAMDGMARTPSSVYELYVPVGRVVRFVG